MQSFCLPRVSSQSLFKEAHHDASPTPTAQSPTPPHQPLQSETWVAEGSEGGTAEGQDQVSDTAARSATGLMSGGERSSVLLRGWRLRSFTLYLGPQCLCLPCLLPHRNAGSRMGINSPINQRFLIPRPSLTAKRLFFTWGEMRVEKQSERPRGNPWEPAQKWREALADLQKFRQMYYGHKTSIYS